MKLNNETAPTLSLKGIAVGFERAEALRSSAPSGNEAFAQIFADMNSRRDLGQLEAAANSRAARPAEADAPVRKERAGATDKKIDRADTVEPRDENNEDAEHVSDADDSTPRDTQAADDKKADQPENKDTKTEYKAEEKVAQTTQTDTAPVKKEVGEVVVSDVVEAVSADELAAALVGETEIATDTASEKAVPVLTPQAKADETKPLATAKTDTQGQEGETAQKPDAEADALKHLTFRQGLTNRHDQAGKAGDDASATGDVPADTGAPVAESVKPEHKNNLGQHIKAALQEVRSEGSDVKTPDAVNAAREEFKNLRAGQTAQAPSENTDKNSDRNAEPQASTQPHPAAGSRAISMSDKAIGSPAPAPTGIAGGGSPSLKGEGAVNAANAAQTNHAGHLAPGEKLSFAGYVKAGKESGMTPYTTPAEQVSVHMFRAAKGGGDRFDMQLHPAELGRVDVRLEIGKDGLVRAFITADNQAAFDMLQKDSRTLERSLEQAGLQTDAGSLNFNLRERQEQAEGGEEGKGASGHDKLAKMKEEKELEAKKLAGVLNYSMNAQGRLDLRV